MTDKLTPLLPCPFCGSEVAIMPGESKCLGIICTGDSSCKGTGLLIAFGHRNGGVEGAIKQWNARQALSSPTPSDEREAFEAQATPDVGFGFKRNSFRPDDYEGLYLQGQWVGWQARGQSRQVVPAPSDEVVILLNQLRGLLGCTPESYKTLARNYTPGLADVIERLAAMNNGDAAIRKDVGSCSADQITSPPDTEAMLERFEAAVNAYAKHCCYMEEYPTSNGDHHVSKNLRAEMDSARLALAAKFLKRGEG